MCERKSQETTHIYTHLFSVSLWGPRGRLLLLFWEEWNVIRSAWSASVRFRNKDKGGRQRGVADWNSQQTVVVLGVLHLDRTRWSWISKLRCFLHLLISSSSSSLLVPLSHKNCRQSTSKTQHPCCKFWLQQKKALLTGVSKTSCCVINVIAELIFRRRGACHLLLQVLFASEF